MLNLDGIAIQQRDYVEDTNTKDEWSIGQPFTIGMSTDDYTDICDCDQRGSNHYANTFYNIISDSMGTGMIGKNYHYNYYLTKTASKNDFSVNGAISNYIDFMIYIGHGYEAFDSKGNYLHYTRAVDGTTHTTAHTEEKYNVFSNQTVFGSDSSDLRWAWLYTCNFLKTNTYVTENSLRSMMGGAHIVMGYASKSTLCDAMAETFAECLRNGIPIYDAYFMAGHYGEATIEPVDHFQRILFIPQARYETIYSPRASYQYNTSDVLIHTRNIHDPYN